MPLPWLGSRTPDSWWKWVISPAFHPWEMKGSTKSQNHRKSTRITQSKCWPFTGLPQKSHPVPDSVVPMLFNSGKVVWPKSPNNEEWDIPRNNQSKTKKCEKGLLPWEQRVANWCQTFRKIISPNCKMQWWGRRQKEAVRGLLMLFFIYLLACVVCIHHTHTPTHSTQLSLWTFLDQLQKFRWWRGRKEKKK